MDGLPETTISALPWPVCHVGYVFSAYSSDEHSPAHFCNCAAVAIRNFIVNAAEERRRLLRSGRPTVHDGVLWHNCYLFPRSVRQETPNAHFDDGSLLERLRFRSGLCHRCQRAVPPHRHYCDHSYFENVFARIIRHDLYTLGFDWVARPLPFVCTAAQVELLPTDFGTTVARYELLNGLYYGRAAPESLHAAGLASHVELHREQRLVAQRYQAGVANVKKHVIAELKRHYDFPATKRGLQRESVLYHSVRNIFRSRSIIRHARPSFLDGLELDIWIPELRLGIEFQGEQHVSAVDHWGGMPALLSLQDRDRRKKVLCEKEGVTLVCFDADADLNESAVAARLRSLPTRAQNGT